MSERLHRWMSRALAALVLTGCAAGSGKPAAGPESAHVVGIKDEQFAGAVRDLLGAPLGSKDRARLLASVVARQMDRATTDFRAHEGGRGVTAVVGALYLVHPGELGEDTLGPSGYEALKETVRELAFHGDDGRARALYEMLVRLAPADARSDVQDHLQAIATWTRDAMKAGPPMIATGELETADVARSLLEPTQDAKDEAEKATLDWIATAVDLQVRFRERKAHPTREEIGEAVRALHWGNEVLVAMHLRDADATGALRALGKSATADAVRPELKKALSALTPMSTAADWLEVLHALTPRERDPDDDVLEDRELLRAATFGVAMEAYRIDPTFPESATLVAAILQDLGMAEASPAVVVDTVRAHPDPRTISGSMTVTLRAMVLEREADDADAVRRTYAAAGSLLKAADGKSSSDVHPNAARVRALMGEVELQQGRLDAARALLRQAASEEKSGAVLMALARIDHHDDQIKAALSDLSAALDAPDTVKDPALKGEALLMSGDLEREAGDNTAARQGMVDALIVLTEARANARAEERARVEQVLSRVLDRFGQKEKAQQALERAFEATPHDKRQIADTLGRIIARAFVRRDLLAARDGLTRAIAAELDDEDLVYYALWVRLLERLTGQPTDGAPAKVFASIPDDGRWAGKLAAFGAGKLPASRLAELAKTPTEKTEATFYEAIDLRASGADPDNHALKAVLKGNVVDLMEVVIAEDMLRAMVNQPPFAVPAGIPLP